MCFLQLIDQNVHEQLGNIWNPILNFIIKTIRNQRVLEQLKRK